MDRYLERGTHNAYPRLFLPTRTLIGRWLPGEKFQTTGVSFGRDGLEWLTFEMGVLLGLICISKRLQKDWFLNTSLPLWTIPFPQQNRVVSWQESSKKGTASTSNPLELIAASYSTLLGMAARLWSLDMQASFCRAENLPEALFFFEILKDFTQTIASRILHSDGRRRKRRDVSSVPRWGKDH